MHKAHGSLKLSLLGIMVLAIGNISAQQIHWNVLFFMSDEHSPHFMSINSQAPQNISTPNIERLAQGGMVFDKTYTAYPVCAPTRANVITGVYKNRVSPWKCDCVV